MKLSKENSQSYHWGDKCRGWHLVKSENLSIIEELMPPNTKEQKHYHHFSEQFFRILSGTATFEIADEILELEAGQGVHILPQTIHRISNNTSEELEFILISQPTTRGDRINEPFDKVEKFNLNGKKFTALSNSENGEVSTDTIFSYRQEKDIVWATYRGGDVVFGTLSGYKKQNKLFFTYQHQNKESEFMSGKCETLIENLTGKIQLTEKWQWTCRDFSKGKSVLIEVS